MPYRVEVSGRIRQALARLPRQDQARIVAALQGLGNDPRPTGCEAVKAALKGTYRIRVGDYRVVYTVLDAEQVIVVARVARRGEGTYERLG